MAYLDALADLLALDVVVRRKRGRKGGQTVRLSQSTYKDKNGRPTMVK